MNPKPTCKPPPFTKVDALTNIFIANFGFVRLAKNNKSGQVNKLTGTIFDQPINKPVKARDQ